jgi:hypothetical protein
VSIATDGLATGLAAQHWEEALVVIACISATRLGL